MCIPKNNIEMLKSIFEDLLDELTPREAKILKLKNGFDGCVWNIERIAREFNITKNEVIEFEQKALTKLRHPKRAIKLLKTVHYKNLRYQTPYYENYQEIILQALKNDINNYSENKEFETMYLHHIINKYKFKDNFPIDQSYSVTLEELDFCIRTYNCLKRVEIDSLHDILMYEDIKKIRNLGRKSSSETFNKLLTLCGEKIESFPFIQNLDETYKKLYEKEKNKINVSPFPEIELITYDDSKIYNELNINSIYETAKSLFDIDLSPSLINILLINGYFDITQLFNNSNKVIETLNNHGYSNESRELYNKLLELSELLYIGNLDMNLFNFIYQNNISTFDDLKNHAINSSKEIKETVDYIINNVDSNKIGNIRHIEFYYINTNEENDCANIFDLPDLDF